jgi:hypothetical protein
MIKSQSALSTVPNTFEIELFEANLDEPPPFEAVSYAWGKEGLNCIVLCNGQQLRVSQTIIDFFNALRSTESIGTLWIDAICINQASVAEKNVQVPKMRAIYSKAETVWVWLGRGSPETDIVFDHLPEVEPASVRWSDAECTTHSLDGKFDNMIEPRRRYKGQYKDIMDMPENY